MAAFANVFGLQKPSAFAGQMLHSGRFSGMRVRPTEKSPTTARPAESSLRSASATPLHSGPSGIATSASQPFFAMDVFTTAPLCHFRSQVKLPVPVLSSAQK